MKLFQNILGAPTLFSGKKYEINYYNSYLNKYDFIPLKTLSSQNYNFTNEYHPNKFSKKNSK